MARKQGMPANAGGRPTKVFTLVSGKEALEAVKTPEGSRALYEDICRALGITPNPPASPYGLHGRIAGPVSGGCKNR